MRFDSPSELAYEVVDGWGCVPPEVTLAEVSGVATDSNDRVFAFNRGPNPVIVFDSDGRFDRTWGAGMFKHPHGIFIGPGDEVYCVDDAAHCVVKCTPDGEVLASWDVAGPADSGYDGSDYHTIQRAAPPFNRPTNVALSPTGDLYVADGYGNCRIHKFAPDGRQLISWGQPGKGPGHFRVPHGIAVGPDGTVYVADRENHRVQLFDGQGNYLDEWAGMQRPAELKLDDRGNVFVANGSPGDELQGAERQPSHVAVLASDGKPLARWGGKDGCAPGSFRAAHGLWIDSKGSVYVAEVITSNSGGQLTPADCHTLQKFVRR